MAGEMLVQIVRAARYDALRPVLDAIDAGRSLDADAETIVRAILDGPDAPSAHGSRNLSTVRRILAHPSLAPRWFLSPRALEDAAEALLYAHCFEGGGAWRLSPISGPTWAVLEYAIPDMDDVPALSEAFLQPRTPRSEPLAHPARGETSWRMVRADALPALAEAVSTLSAASQAAAADSPVAERTARELDGLKHLITAAQATPGRGLAYSFLL